MSGKTTIFTKEWYSATKCYTTEKTVDPDDDPDKRSRHEQAYDMCEDAGLCKPFEKTWRVYGGSIKADGRKSYKSGTYNRDHGERDLRGTRHAKRMDRAVEKAISLDDLTQIN
jgi:hypothetical protein